MQCPITIGVSIPLGGVSILVVGVAVPTTLRRDENSSYALNISMKKQTYTRHCCYQLLWTLVQCCYILLSCFGYGTLQVIHPLLKCLQLPMNLKSVQTINWHHLQYEESTECRYTQQQYSYPIPKDIIINLSFDKPCSIVHVDWQLSYDHVFQHGTLVNSIAQTSTNMHISSRFDR